MKEYRTTKGKLIESKEGLLWVEGKIVGLPEADLLAALHGLHCAERLVKAIEQGETKK